MKDAKGILECYKDRESRKGFMSYLKNIEEAKDSCRKKIKEMKKKKPSEEKWIIEVHGEFAGWVELGGLNEKFFEHRGHIGYCIHPKFRRKGLATKVTKLMMNYAFKKYKLKRLEAMCRDFNKASAGVLKKSGFKLEGILRKNKCKDGKYLNDMMWAKIK
jgi:RimJ/RimL family protein N-acetyltransferase